MSEHSSSSVGKFFANFLLCLVVAIPLVGYLWETLNQLLSLKFDGQRLLISLPVLAALLLVLFLFSRVCLNHFSNTHRSEEQQ